MAPKKKVEILVTGGSGFLGKGIVEELLKQHPDWSISILDLQPPVPAIARRLRHFFKADITSTDSVNNVFVDYNPDLVLHTAGVVPARKSRYSKKQSDWARVKAVNYDGTKNVLDAAMASGCRHFVYTSSCTVVTDDLDHDYFHMDEGVPIGFATLHYGKSKGMAETYVMSETNAEKGLIACALRPSTIIGPGDLAVISVMHDLIAKHETYFIVGDGYNLYDFVYIDNVVRAHVLAVENLLTTQTAAGEVFFISNEEPVYFWDFLAYIWAQFGHVPRYRFYIPTSVAWLVGIILEWVSWLTGASATLDRGSVMDGIRNQYSNNKKATQVLGYEPVIGLAEGVRRSCEDYKQYLDANAPKTEQLLN